MCKFHSGIVTYKNRSVITDLDKDSHTGLLEIGGLKDTSINPNFVRVEILPTDGDIFNHKLSNWKLHVDQDLIPDWFDKEKAEKLMKISLKNVFKERFIIDNNIKRKIIGNERFFIKNSNVKAWDNSSVEAYDNSSVKAWDNSSVIIPYSTNINIKGVYNNASIKDIPNGKIILTKNLKVKKV